MTPDEILEEVESIRDDAEVIQFPDLKDALVGWAEPWTEGGSRPLRLIYSAAKCIECLERQGMTEEEAREWVSFNTEGSYLGPHTPIIMY